LGLGDKVHGVVKGHDRFAVELGLAGKGKGFHRPGFGEARPFQALLSGVVTLDSVFLFDHMSQEGGVGQTLAGRLFEIFLPMGGQTVETQMAKLFL
jgi:hypothetical protein